MHKRGFRLIAACLAICLLLTGCSLLDFGGYFQNLLHLFGRGELTAFDQMEYTRPDMEIFSQALEKTCREAETQRDIDALTVSILEFYDAYDDFYTGYALAMIHYTKDVTDPYWQAEYAFCTENSAQVDAGIDRLFRKLAKSPLRDKLETDAYFGAGFFDSYEGESLYDETFTALLEQEAALQSEYYRISGEAAETNPYSEEFYTTYGSQMAALFVELIRVRQQQASYAGYASYPEFAYDFHHSRDYTVQQATAYMADIRVELVPLYRQVMTEGIFSNGLPASSQMQTRNYVYEASQNMGGVVAEAFNEMERCQLYDIAYSPNKFDASYEIFLRNYRTPYVFVNPTRTIYDKLSFAHEFGHFCSDYAAGGSAAGVDVAEIFSQGMEYLSLCYTKDPGLVEQLRLTTGLCTYVEQTAYASFEHQVYSLQGDALTVENVRALYAQIGAAYGLDALRWDSRGYVRVTHFFISPMYVISYVVSNDVAFQLYQMERSKSGSGLACLEKGFYTRQSSILAFVEEMQLESPFTPGRLQQVRRTLEATLQPKENLPLLRQVSAFCLVKNPAAKAAGYTV